MNSSEAAESIVRMSLEGFEVAARITGKGAEKIAIALYTMAKDKKMTKGKTNLNNMLKSGSPLQIFTLDETQLKKFHEEAKKYGVLYTALIDKKTLSMLKLFLYNQSMNQLNGNDVDVYGSYVYVKKTQQVYLAMFNLRLIQLLTFIPRDLFFLTHFQTLYNIYAKAILLLIPLTYLETADYNFFMSEEEMIEYLRDDGDAKTQQDLNRKLFEEEMQREAEHPQRYGINAPYPNKYKIKLNDILKKKISPILRKTSKYQRLFMTSMDIHGRALELRYYLNNSIMHVFEAEEIYDETMNKLWNDMDLVVKGKKVFFSLVVVSLHELKEDTPLEVPSTPRTVLNSMGKTMSTGNLDNIPGKLKNRTLRHRHSMRSIKSMSQYDLFKQRSASISRATIASAASSGEGFLSGTATGEGRLPLADTGAG